MLHMDDGIGAWLTVVCLTGIVLFGIIGILLYQRWSSPKINGKMDTQELTIGASKLIVEKALTVREQAQGLSSRQSLDQDAGMLFDFHTAQYPRMWMKDMHFALDFIWVDAGGQVVGTTNDIVPQTWPKTYGPPTPARYVIEVNAGWTRSHGLQMGDIITGL